MDKQRNFESFYVHQINIEIYLLNHTNIKPPIKFHRFEINSTDINTNLLWFDRVRNAFDTWTLSYASPNIFLAFQIFFAVFSYRNPKRKNILFTQIINIGNLQLFPYYATYSLQKVIYRKLDLQIKCSFNYSDNKNTRNVRWSNTLHTLSCLA